MEFKVSKQREQELEDYGNGWVYLPVVHHEPDNYSSFSGRLWAGMYDKVLRAYGLSSTLFRAFGANRDREGIVTRVNWSSSTQVQHRAAAPLISDGLENYDQYGLWSGATSPDYEDAFTDWDELDRVQYGEDGE
jgi:hypothetical protein